MTAPRLDSKITSSVESALRPYTDTMFRKQGGRWMAVVELEHVERAEPRTRRGKGSLRPAAGDNWRKRSRVSPNGSPPSSRTPSSPVTSEGRAMSDMQATTVIRREGSSVTHVVTAPISAFWPATSFGSNFTGIPLPVVARCGARLRGGFGVVMRVGTPVRCRACRFVTGVNQQAHKGYYLSLIESEQSK